MRGEKRPERERVHCDGHFDLFINKTCKPISIKSRLMGKEYIFTNNRDAFSTFYRDLYDKMYTRKRVYYG